LRKNYAERCGLSSAGWRLCRLALEERSEGCVLRDGERGEPEAAVRYEVRLAPARVLAPDHGTPDDLRGKGDRAEGRREFEIAGGAAPEEVEVLDPCAREAEVEEVDPSQASHPRREPLGQRRARHRTPVSYLTHAPSITIASGVYHGDAPLPTGIGRE
jgi:hypothetical protein